MITFYSKYFRFIQTYLSVCIHMDLIYFFVSEFLVLKFNAWEMIEITWIFWNISLHSPTNWRIRTLDNQKLFLHNFIWFYHTCTLKWLFLCLWALKIVLHSLRTCFLSLVSETSLSCYGACFSSVLVTGYHPTEWK